MRQLGYNRLCSRVLVVVVAGAREDRFFRKKSCQSARG